MRLFQKFILIGIASLIGAGAMSAQASSTGWIWAESSTDASTWAPVETYTFQKQFTIPDANLVEAAELSVAVDNVAEVYLNDIAIGRFEAWNPLAVHDVTDAIKVGENTLSVEATNSHAGPAGLLLELKINFANVERPTRIGTNQSWVVLSPDDSDHSVPVQYLGPNGIAPWGLCLPERDKKDQSFPTLRADGKGVKPLNDMLQRFYEACNIEFTGTYALAWLPRAMLWISDDKHASDATVRRRYASRLSSIRISPEGYVSCHQHEGLAHSEGWPFPFPSQSHGVDYLFMTGDLPFAEAFQFRPLTNVSGWTLNNAQTSGFSPAKGWGIKLTGADSVITSPPFDIDAYVAPFVRIKWDASGLPEGSKPRLQWTTEEHPEFSSERQMAFPGPSQASKWPIQDFDIPVVEMTKGQGRLTGLRILLGNPEPGSLSILRIFSAVDSRHVINNPNYIIAATDYFSWTGDITWLKKNLSKLRLGLKFMLDEFGMRQEHLVWRPWVGHDGSSGLALDEDGNKVIRHGYGIGGNYWDLMPFGGKDPLATIYAYVALNQMSALEAYLSESPIDFELPQPEDSPQYLSELAKKVRSAFQRTFWNPETRRFAPIDDQEIFQDYGYTFLNNEAIFYGLATDKQAKDIMAWQTGERIVIGDTSQGEDIYRWRFGPRASTRRNLLYYQYVWSNPEALAFGDQVQDGGAVLGFSFHDLVNRICYLGAENAWVRLLEIFEWYQDVEDAGGARAYYSEPGRGTLQGGGTAGGLGIDEEFYESVLVPGITLEGFIGFEAEPSGFRLKPQLPKSLDSLSVEAWAYRDLLWDVTLTRQSLRFEVRTGALKQPLKVSVPSDWTMAVKYKDNNTPSKLTPNEAGYYTLRPGHLEQLVFSEK